MSPSEYNQYLVLEGTNSQNSLHSEFKTQKFSPQKYAIVFGNYLAAIQHGKSALYPMVEPYIFLNMKNVVGVSKFNFDVQAHEEHHSIKENLKFFVQKENNLANQLKNIPEIGDLEVLNQGNNTFKIDLPNIQGNIKGFRIKSRESGQDYFKPQLKKLPTLHYKSEYKVKKISMHATLEQKDKYTIVYKVHCQTPIGDNFHCKLIFEQKFEFSIRILDTFINENSVLLTYQDSSETEVTFITGFDLNNLTILPSISLKGESISISKIIPVIDNFYLLISCDYESCYFQNMRFFPEAGAAQVISVHNNRIKFEVDFKICPKNYKMNPFEPLNGLLISSCTRGSFKFIRLKLTSEEVQIMSVSYSEPQISESEFCASHHLLHYGLSLPYFYIRSSVLSKKYQYQKIDLSSLGFKGIKNMRCTSLLVVVEGLLLNTRATETIILRKRELTQKQSEFDDIRNLIFHTVDSLEHAFIYDVIFDDSSKFKKNQLLEHSTVILKTSNGNYKMLHLKKMDHKSIQQKQLRLEIPKVLLTQEKRVSEYALTFKSLIAGGDQTRYFRIESQLNFAPNPSIKIQNLSSLNKVELKKGMINLDNHLTIDGFISEIELDSPHSAKTFSLINNIKKIDFIPKQQKKLKLRYKSIKRNEDLVMAYSIQKNPVFYIWSNFDDSFIKLEEENCTNVMSVSYSALKSSTEIIVAILIYQGNQQELRLRKIKINDPTKIHRFDSLVVKKQIYHPSLLENYKNRNQPFLIGTQESDYSSLKSFKIWKLGGKNKTEIEEIYEEQKDYNLVEAVTSGTIVYIVLIHDNTEIIVKEFDTNKEMIISSNNLKLQMHLTWKNMVCRKSEPHFTCLLTVGESLTLLKFDWNGENQPIKQTIFKSYSSFRSDSLNYIDLDSSVVVVTATQTDGIPSTYQNLLQSRVLQSRGLLIWDLSKTIIGADSYPSRFYNLGAGYSSYPFVFAKNGILICNYIEKLSTNYISLEINEPIKIKMDIPTQLETIQGTKIQVRDVNGSVSSSIFIDRIFKDVKKEQNQGKRSSSTKGNSMLKPSQNQKGSDKKIEKRNLPILQILAILLIVCLSLFFMDKIRRSLFYNDSSISERWLDEDNDATSGEIEDKKPIIDNSLMELT